MQKKILGINIIPQTKNQILEKIRAFLQNPPGFFQIVSLNPEIMVQLQRDAEFRKILNEAEVRHIDGVGLTLAGKILGIKMGERIAGVDLMNEILEFCTAQNLRVLFIGGRDGVAEHLAEIYSKKYPASQFLGLRGPSNIQQSLNSPIPLNTPNPLFPQISSFHPQLVFVSFGSPFQEKWIHQNRDKLGNCVAMGVGGAFDFLTGAVPRAPRVVSSFGGEWLYRLIKQPWRIKRQLNLIKFLWLILKQKFGIIKS